VTISAQRLAEEWATDDDVLASLQSNGDHPSVKRSVDVSFRGERGNLEALARHLEADGFQLAYRSTTDEGDPWLFLERDQSTEREAIHAMTKACLEAAADFNVTHDGWGCLAHNEHGPINNENPK
jgi:hypothetical protein